MCGTIHKTGSTFTPKTFLISPGTFDENILNNFKLKPTKIGKKLNNIIIMCCAFLEIHNSWHNFLAKYYFMKSKNRDVIFWRLIITSQNSEHDFIMYITFLINIDVRIVGKKWLLFFFKARFKISNLFSKDASRTMWILFLILKRLRQWIRVFWVFFKQFLPLLLSRISLLKLQLDFKILKNDSNSRTFSRRV